MSVLKENENSERAEFERECRQKLDSEWQQKESKLAAKFKSERDAELDRVVDKLEAEVNRDKKQMQIDLEDRLE